jgi:hypothetical protein
MSADHKAALALGRNQGRVVRRYLEALEANKPKRGRKRTPESVEKRLLQVKRDIITADPLTRLTLAQERIDLERDLKESAMDAFDVAALEQDFIKTAAEYSRRKGITYAAWREVGVAPSILKEAGISARE